MRLPWHSLTLALPVDPKCDRLATTLGSAHSVDSSMSALERHKRDPDAISEPDWQMKRR
jgi:hypothetical protein